MRNRVKYSKITFRTARFLVRTLKFPDTLGANQDAASAVRIDVLATLSSLTCYQRYNHSNTGSNQSKVVREEVLESAGCVHGPSNQR